MTSDELDAAKQELERLDSEREEVAEAMVEIKGQIDRAKALRKTGAPPPDPTWMPRAKYALRMRAMDHQSLLREAADLRRDIRQAEVEVRRAEAPYQVNYFKAAAEELLPDDLYETVRRRAKELRADADS